MRNLLNFPLALFAIILSLAITGCGDDDSGDNFDEAQLTTQTWGLSSFTTNGNGRGADVAAMFTAAEIDSNGYDNEAELAADLDIEFAFSAAFSSLIIDCITNNGVSFNDNNTVDYDFSDDCADGFELALIGGQDITTTWSLSGRNLTVVETSEFGGEIFVETTTYEITVLNSSTLELRLSGNALLTDIGYETAADPSDINITIVYEAL